MKLNHTLPALLGCILISLSIIEISCKKEADQPKIPVIVTLALSDTSYTTAICGGDITSDGGDAIHTRGICWGTGANPSTSNSKTIDGKGIGKFSSSMTNLLPGTTYFVRAYAINTIGTAYGESFSFSTKTYPVKGTLTGIVKLYDRYGNENHVYTDVKIELTDTTNKTVIVYPGTDGKFRVDNLLLGNTSMVIDKPGYGILNSFIVRHTKIIDTLSTIELLEELPFAFQGFQVSYSAGMLHYDDYCDYVSADSYMVTNLICFSKSPNVSLNNCSLEMGTGSYTNVAYINSTSNAATSFSFSSFVNAGFKTGDIIYSVEYPVTQRFFAMYYDQKSVFNPLTYKIGNQSNVDSFVLQQ
jgi:hypothetical protein